MRKVLILLCLFSQIIVFAQRPADFFPCHEEADYIKTWIGYIVQEVTYGYGSDIYPPFAGLYRLKTDFDVYYIANKKYLLDAIRKDSIN
ncbi:MAG: hypothetical protein II525_00360, partial [Bacteroidales bacterium]|nr:hypothetical protein [Bacteroidales bacterium]